MTRVEPRPASSRNIWAALLVIYIVWGSTYLAIKVVVDAGIPPLLGMGVRFMIAGGLMAIWIMIRRGWRALLITRRQAGAVTLIGSLLLLVGNGGVALGEQNVPSGLAALIVGAVPLWLTLLRFGSGQRPAKATWAGVGVGFFGIGLISLSRGGIEGVTTWGVLMVLGATIGWSLGSFLSPHVGMPKDALLATAWQMLLGGAVMIAVAGAIGEWSELDISVVTGWGWVSMVYLITVGSLLAFTSYVWLLEHAPVSLVGTYAYVNPVVAVFLGWLVLSEQVTTIIVVGGLITVLGVSLVVRGERRPGTAEEVNRGHGELDHEPTIAESKPLEQSAR